MNLADVSIADIIIFIFKVFIAIVIIAWIIGMISGFAKFLADIGKLFQSILSDLFPIIFNRLGRVFNSIWSYCFWRNSCDNFTIEERPIEDHDIGHNEESNPLEASNLYCYQCTKKLGLKSKKHRGFHYCDACYLNWADRKNGE